MAGTKTPKARISLKVKKKFLKVLGAQIHNQRKKLHMSLRDLAEESLIDSGHLSNIENGKVNVSAETIFKLSMCLRIDPAHMLDDRR